MVASCKLPWKKIQLKRGRDWEERMVHGLTKVGFKHMTATTEGSCTWPPWLAWSVRASWAQWQVNHSGFWGLHCIINCLRLNFTLCSAEFHCGMLCYLVWPEVTWKHDNRFTFPAYSQWKSPERTSYRLTPTIDKWHQLHTLCGGVNEDTGTGRRVGVSRRED